MANLVAQGTVFARRLVGFGTIPSYTLQWQSLLGMLLVQLQLCHMQGEPNLYPWLPITSVVQIQEISWDGAGPAAAPQSAG